MSFVVTSSHSRAVVLSLALLSIVFSGCLSDDTPEVAGAASLCLPGDIELVILEGAAEGMDPGLAAANTTAQAPASLCVQNGDAFAHEVMLLPADLDNKPDWFPPDAGSNDPHAEHRKQAAGGGPQPLLTASVEPGDTLRVEGFNAHGIVFVHSTDPRYLTSIFAPLEIFPTEPQDYPVVTSNVFISGQASGDTTAGSADTATFDVVAGDLQMVKVDLTWNDEEDDGTGGPAANGEDTLQLRLLDPAGNEVGKKELTKREGTIKIDHTIERTPFPATVPAVGISNASASLDVTHPEDYSQIGPWTVEVAVLAAPGVVPDGDGSTAALPEGGDGHQTWSVKVDFVHVWPKIGMPGTAPAADSAATTI